MLTPEQIKLVENSWGHVLHNALDVGGMFYKKLFETDPPLRRMFNGDIKIQAQKLVDMITFVVHKLDHLEDMVTDVQALGVKHHANLVRSEHYIIVANTLLWTLEQTLGTQWNEEVKEAWSTVYTILSKTMIQAAQDSKAVL